MSKTRVSATVLLLAALHLSTTQPTAAPQQSGGVPQQTGAPSPTGDAPGSGTRQGDAGQPAPQGNLQQPIFRGGIDFVRVDVFVSDRKGQPVVDLKEADFQILEDGKPQKVEQFKVVKIDGRPDPNAEPPRQIHSPADEEIEAQRDDVRLFAFFLDDYHVRDSNSRSVREPLTKFIQTQLRPEDMLAVMYPLTSVADVVFTRDHESVVRAIQRFEGRKYDYTPRNELERNYERQPTEVVEKIRNQVVMGALEGLSVRLGGLRDGRKSVIFVSEGFTVLLPPQMRRGNAQAPQPLGSGVSDARTEQLAEIQGQFDLDSRMRDVYKVANRNNTAFYSLDPRGLAVFEYDIADGGAAGLPNLDQDRNALRLTQETLRNLSLETDGRAIVNRNTLGDGLAQMVRDSSFYYLIGFTTLAPNDGKFHDIKVQVKRSGVDVRARKGYWALTPADSAKVNAPRAPEMAKPLLQALATLAAPVQAATFVRMWVGTERGDNGKTRVTLTWEPLPILQGVRREQAGRVSLLAADAQGALVFRGRSPDGSSTSGATAAVPPPSGSTAARPAAPALASAPQRLVFNAPPGKLDLRVTIEGAAGGTLDTESRAIDVPDLTAPRAAMSTPRVFRARNAREFQGLSADAEAVPVASREFSRVERLLIRFDVYGPGSEKPVPTAALLGRTGQKMMDLPVASASAGGTHQIDLGLNTMVAGDYLVEITVKDASGEEAKELVAVRVGA